MHVPHLKLKVAHPDRMTVNPRVVTRWDTGIFFDSQIPKASRSESWWLNCPDRQTFSDAARANFGAIRSSRFGQLSDSSDMITARVTRGAIRHDTRPDEA